MKPIQQVMIAGGAGFIGQNLVRALLSSNKTTRITVVDKKDFVTTRLLPMIPDRLICHEIDILDQKNMEDLFGAQKFDVLINLAACAGVAESIADPRSNFEANVVGQFNLLDLARMNGVKKFVFASTGGAIIGDGYPPLTEDMVPNPLSPYGVSKLVGELYAGIFERCYALNTCCLRFSNVYGEYSIHKSNLIPKFIRSAMTDTPARLFGDGTQERDFIYVGDLVEGICRVLKRDVGGIIQLATGRKTSINTVASLISSSLPDGYQLNWESHPERSGEVYQTWCDNSKSVRLLGDYVQTPVHEGLKKTIDWYVDQYRESD